MIATNPITIDGKTYDRYNLNLAITGSYNSDGTPDANVAMRLVPVRIVEGAVESDDARAIGISLGSLEGTDEATQTAVAAIQSALQAYITARGI